MSKIDDKQIKEMQDKLKKTEEKIQEMVFKNLAIDAGNIEELSEKLNKEGYRLICEMIENDTNYYLVKIVDGFNLKEVK